MVSVMKKCKKSLSRFGVKFLTEGKSYKVYHFLYEPKYVVNTDKGVGFSLIFSQKGMDKFFEGT